MKADVYERKRIALNNEYPFTKHARVELKDGAYVEFAYNKEGFGFVHIALYDERYAINRPASTGLVRKRNVKKFIESYGVPVSFEA